MVNMQMVRLPIDLLSRIQALSSLPSPSWTYRAKTPWWSTLLTCKMGQARFRNASVCQPLRRSQVDRLSMRPNVRITSAARRRICELWGKLGISWQVWTKTPINSDYLLFSVKRSTSLETSSSRLKNSTSSRGSLVAESASYLKPGDTALLALTMQTVVKHQYSTRRAIYRRHKLAQVKTWSTREDSSVSFTILNNLI